jgi:hypothetical protein
VICAVDLAELQWLRLDSMLRQQAWHEKKGAGTAGIRHEQLVAVGAIGLAASARHFCHCNCLLC